MDLMSVVCIPSSYTSDVHCDFIFAVPWRPPGESYIEGFYVGAHSDASTSGWSWPDGSELSEEDPVWGSGEPNDSNSILCTMMTHWKGWKLADIYCNAARPFVCEFG